MSRQTSSSSSKYKISAPQPFVDSGFDRFTPDNGPYPSFAPKRGAESSGQPYDGPLSGVSQQSGISSLRSDPSGSRPQLRQDAGPPTTASGPMRPARSKMRQAPTEPVAAGRPARPNRPTLTADTRRPSDPSRVPQDLYSPISPISPDRPAPSFNDPFAADRSQRSELRDHYKQQQAPTTGVSGSGSDKLRSAVGAFMTAGRSQDSPAKRPGKSEARHKTRPKDESWDMSADDGRFGELDMVMGRIKTDWPFVMGSDFSPSTLALSLLSPQSTTLPAHPSLPSFLKLHDSLSAALQSSVQSHFQSFAASLPAHADFLSTLGRAQDQVKTSKQALRDARDGFAGRGKGELAGIRGRERTVRDMLKLLDTIEHLKQVPDHLESLIGDKKFLPAALILVQSIKAVNKSEINQIGAVSDLKAYFISQEAILTDILVDELQNHLYLKTYYSDVRWHAYLPGQRDLPVINESNVSNGPVPSASRPTSIQPSSGDEGPETSRFSRYLADLAVRPSPDPSELMSTDMSLQSPASMTGSTRDSQAFVDPSLATSIQHVNPEVDSYGYIETLLEALHVLDKLGNAMETIAQRVTGEIHALVETTLDEVEERSEKRREDSALARSQHDLQPDVADTSTRRHSVVQTTDTLRIAISLESMGPPHHALLLKDLFWTLYSKLAAVLEGHRIIYEVARWIPSRRDYRDGSSSKGVSPTIPVLEIWKPVQQEVRNLLHMYLSDSGQGSMLDRHHVPSVNEVLRDGRQIRDKQRQMYRFNDTDGRALTQEIKSADEALQKSLKTSVPGLVHMQSADGNGINQQSVLQGSMAGADDRYTATAKHRSLIPPNPFNVSTLFQPTLSFVERATAIVPPGFEDETSAFGSVLEDFVVKVFLPQLDEKVTASFQQAVSGYDAYQPDRQLPGTEKPPLKSSVRVMSLIHSLCVMLETTPFHKENYSRLIIGVIVQYYQQCSARFRELVSLAQSVVSLDDPLLALPALWAQGEELIHILTEMRSVMPADRREVANIASQEIKVEQKLLGPKTVIETQLVNSSRKLEALGSLCESLRWFIDALLDLQSLSEDPLSPLEGPGTRADPDPLTVVDTESPPRLPLTRAMKQRYDAIIQTYEQLAEMVLNTIRLEVRCRIRCNLHSSMQKGDFRPESEALEPDADVENLAIVLLESEEIVTRTLSTEDRDFVFRGLGHLVDHMFIHSARHIKLVNAAGVRKIRRNMLALQQSLRGISRSQQDGVLHMSNVYWDMYERDPKDIIETLKTSKPLFTFEDYNTMLNLICKSDMKEASSSELNTLLIDLHALSMSNDGWE